MLSQRSHKIKYLGFSLFIALFLLFAFSFYEILIKSPNEYYRYELAALSSDANALDKIQQPPVNKNWLPQFDNSNFKVITNHIKLLTNHRSVHHRINTLQKIEFLIVHIRPPGFYCHYHLRDTDDPPILS